mmetsp:Transcript_14062/g.35388  ORF Transcript_14062/g.35388 Transcript_14062/m.35388 type:complete len:185 (-) Transcript_14062:107-661(-)
MATRISASLLLLLSLSAAVGAAEAPDSNRGGLRPLVRDLVEPLKAPAFLAGKTLFAYFGITLALKAATTLIAWVVQPTRLGLVRPLLKGLHAEVHPSTTSPHSVVDRLACHYEHIEKHAEHILGPLARCTGLDAGHLGRCVAESAVVHLYLRPVLAPLKVFAAYTVASKEGFFGMKAVEGSKKK